MNSTLHCFLTSFNVMKIRNSWYRFGILPRKKHKKKTTLDKVANTPTHCFIENGDLHDRKISPHLDKQWYIDLAKERIEAFYV